MMPRAITWLHLSDRHTNSPKTGWDADAIIESLVLDLVRMQQGHGLRPDLIFFTGDLAWGQVGEAKGESLSDQFAEAHRFLEAVRKAFEPEVPQLNVFLVPGNHDIDRTVVTPEDTSWLDNRSNGEDVTELIRAGGEKWKRYIARLNQYRAFLERHGYHHLLSDVDRLLYTAIREVSGKTVGIAGFNSAWSCCRNNEKGQLWTGGVWQPSTLHAAVKKADLKIALVHHPGGWLKEFEANQFWRYGLKKFDVRLHGHEHEQWPEVVNGKATISAGACYDRSDRLNGYNITRLLLDERKPEVWLRRYDARGGGWVPDHIAGETDERGVWILKGFDWLSLNGPSEHPSGGGGDNDKAAGGGDAVSVVGAFAPIAPALLQEKATKLGEAIQNVLGSDLKDLVPPGEQTTEVTVAQRVVRSGEATFQQNIIVQFNLAGPRTIPPTPTADNTGTDEIKRGLDDVQKLIKNFRLDDAALALDKLLTSEPLTPRDRFRILVKQGQISYLRGNAAEAATIYRDAVTYVESSDNYARYFMALAAELEGKADEAHSKASALRADAPEFERSALAAMLIRTSPAAEPAARLVEELGEDQCKIPEIAYTIARRFGDEGDFGKAIEYARLAATDHTWTDARSTLASLLLEKRFGKIVTAGHSRPPVTDWQDFSEVYELYTVAAAEVERGQAPWHAAMLRLNIAITLTAVGRREDAFLEYEKALRLAPDDPEVLYRLAMSLVALGRIDDAITRVRTWLEGNNAAVIKLLLAQLLGSRFTGKGEQQCLDEAIFLLKSSGVSLASLDPGLRADWISVLVQLQIHRRDLGAAKATLDTTPAEWLDEPLRFILTTDLEHAAGRVAEARVIASRAAAAVSEATHPATIRQIALSLEELEEWSRAAALWERVASLTALGDDERHLVSCAQRGRDYETVVRVCRALRQHGVIQKEAINAELSALERVSFERLLAALQELLAIPSLDEQFRRVLRAQQSYVAGHLDRPELVERDATLLPRVADIENASIGRMVVEVLRRQLDPVAALKYAYELYRRFPEEPHAHLAVMFATGLPDREPTPISNPDVVAPGTAVKYRLNDSGEESWVICEDLPSPKPMLNEQPIRSPVVRSMLGMHVGGTFTLRAGSSMQRDATIAEIISKYTYRVRDVIDGFEERFPEHHNVVMKIHPGEDGKAGLEALLRSVDERSKRVTQLVDIYRHNPVTVYLLADALGRSVFETVRYIGSSPELELRCTSGTVQDQAAARTAFTNAKEVVVDPTALSTLYLLSESTILSAEAFFAACPVRLLVSEYTLADAREALGSISFRGSMWLGKEGDQFVRHVTTDEEARRQHDALKTFIRVVRSKCSIIPARQPSPEEAAEYTVMEEVLGSAGAESVRLVEADPGRALWTDEIFTAQFAFRRVGGNRRVWTQSLFNSLARGSHISARTFEASTTLLFRAGYQFTALSARTLMYATEKSAWRASNAPLSSLLNQFGSANTSPVSAANSAAAYLVQVWRHRETQRNVKIARNITMRMLSQLNNHPRGGAMISYVNQKAQKALSSERAKQFRRTVNRFLRGE
jgi:tetratricopeptide (TPR) repeat protein/predicted MPP superfamily phosphohydrolase